MSALVGLLASVSACSAGDAAGGFFDSDDGEGESGATGFEGDGDPTTGDGDGDGTDTGDPSEGDCLLDCGPGGNCVQIDGEDFCECPEETAWNPQGCDACPVIDAAGQYDIALDVVSFDGRFRVAGVAPPISEYDDANLWLENAQTGDRVLLGNTHDVMFAVRVTPGIYDLVYEVETPGAIVPHNPRAVLGKIALFSSTSRDINIPAATASGPILLNDLAPPVEQYDDAQLLLRDKNTGDEVLAGNTHDGSYSVTVVPGSYEVVYRVETPGPVTPRNDGAVLSSLELTDAGLAQAINITSVTVSGSFTIAELPAPMSEYDDANIELESPLSGTVKLGNTHDGSYEIQVIPGSYTTMYRHETGANVPQNHHAVLEPFELSEAATYDIDVPMVALTGSVTLNGAVPPASEFDDGIVTLRGIDGDDEIVLANTHDGTFQVNVIPGTYAAYYAQETSGGTVPDNKSARIAESVLAGPDPVVLDIPAVAITGDFTVAGDVPPSSEYEDGRIYLRNLVTGDSLLLGSTHVGSYGAIVVPGEYEVFYVQETAGDLLPGNQNASLGSVSIAAPMSLNLDVPVVDLSGQVVLMGGPAPADVNDGGQLYLRALAGDSVLLGESYAPSYAAKLVTGTYGVYYRSTASMTMPQNENGRFACITVE